MLRAVSTYIVAFVLGLTAVHVHAQEPNDCINAIGVCSNRVINENSNGPGINDFASGGNSAGCLLGLEHQSVWLYIQIASGNNLGFTITPVGGAGQDYDFAVFGPDVSCGSMGAPIRCSWADAFCGYCPSTGLSATATDLSESGNGDGFVRWLDVSPGETYYILVDNYSASSTGFSLNWTGNAVLDCSVTMDCPVFNLGNDIVLCEGQNTTIGVPAGTGESYLWSNGATTNEIQVSQPGVYWLDVTKDGCTVRDEVRIFVNSDISVDLGMDVSVCSDDLPVDLTAQLPGGTSGVELVWQDGSTAATFQAFSSGTYWVEASNGQCTYRDSINISVYPVPVFDLGQDRTICAGESIVLDASTTPVSAYNWQDGSTGAAFTVFQSGTYIATASNAGCSFSDTVHIEVLPTPVVDLGSDTAMCEGESLILDMSHLNAETYLWQDGTTSGQIIIDQTGTYSLTASIAQCSSTDTLEVVVYNTPYFELGPDTSICSGNTLQLSALSPFAVSYTWQNDPGGPGFTVGESGSFSATASNPGCSVTDSVTVTVLDAPVLDLGPDTALCEGQVLLLDISGSGAAEVLWQDGSYEDVYTVMESGLYYVEARLGECVTRDTIEVTFNKVPYFDLGLDSAAQQVPLLLCEGESVLLNAYSTFASHYTWQDGSTSADYLAQTTGLYSVTAYNGACAYTDSVRLTFAPAPRVDLGPDTALCAGSTIELDAASDIATGYIWQDGSSDPSMTVQASGTYYVTAVSSSCYDRDTVEIEFLEVPVIDLGSDTVICGGSAVFLDAYSDAATSYLWQDGSSEASVLADTEGTWTVTVANGSCVRRDSVEIEVIEYPEIDLGGDRSLCGIDGFTLQAPMIDGADYTWNNGSTAQVFQVTEEGLIFLTIDTYCGTVTDSLLVTREACGCSVVFPTGFSPNGDNHNDAFYPFVNCENLISFEWEMFNRWGERVFASDNTEEEWRPDPDGVFEMDTYIWVVNFSYEKDGEIKSDVVSGSVLLLK